MSIQAKWFKSDPEFDKVLIDNFKADIESVPSGALDSWKEDHYGRLALILLCDQFSRNCYRGSPDAFKFDEHSLAISQSTVASPELFSKYKHHEKIFITMPLMHSENLANQDLLMSIWEAMIADLTQRGLD
mmetsp:Transcript_19403/g.33006  ORF Transcript_19403/g.33006 Transcript_19403/m.33006 type:complete len:131 (+) Transcript_19403:164-556(+)